MKHALITVPPILISLIMGCAIEPPKSHSDRGFVSSEQDSAMSETLPVKLPEIPFPAESLLPLLEAEFAIRARDYKHGLDKLADQAIQLTDPVLARRALRLAEFLNDSKTAMAMAMRLSELDNSDGAAAASASIWLSRGGEEVLALKYAAMALERGTPVNIAANLAHFHQLDWKIQQQVARLINDLWSNWPNDDHVVIAASLLARLQGRWEAAESTIETLLQRSPEDLRAIMLWTQLQLDQEKTNPYQRIKRAIEKYPHNQELRLQYARLLGAERDLVGAREQFTILLNQEPENPELLLAAGLLDFELKFYEPAVALFQRLVTTGKKTNEANYYIGLIETTLDNYDTAISSFSAVEPSEQFRDAKVQAARLILDIGFLPDIRTFFDNQRQIYPNAAEQLYLLEAEIFRDWPEESIKTYNIGLEVFPESFPLLYGRAMLLEAKGEVSAMEADLRTILSIDPNHAATLNALGYTLTIHTQRYQEAAELIERARALSPDDPAILDSLGWVYFKLGQYGASEKLLRNAYSAFPDPEVAAHLGELLWVQGREIEAQDVWRNGLDRAPNHQIILEALDRLGAELP